MWSCLDHSRLIIERFDDEYVLYNRFSGETHVVNRESKLILDAISLRPSLPEEVQTAISSDPSDLPDISVAQIQEHLAVLEQWGIANRIG